MVNKTKLPVIHLNPTTMAKIRDQQKARTDKPAGKVSETTSSQSQQIETFTPSATPTVSESKTVESKGPELQVESKPKREPRSGSDMDIMIADIETAKMAGGELHLGGNGTLVVMDTPSYFQNRVEEEILQDQAAHKAHGHGHEYKHHNDSALGGHLGTEVVEKVGHHAHHAASHAVAEVKAGAGHLAAEAKTQGVAQAVGSQADNLAHSAAEAAETVATTGTSTAHGVDALTEMVGDSAQAGQQAQMQATHATSETAGKLAEHGGEAAHHLSTGLTTALGVSAAASGGLGAYMLYAGGKELSHGIKEKDGEKVAEGVGQLAVGTRSLAAGTVMAGMADIGGEVVKQVASAAGTVLTPLGLLHGGIDIGLGVKDMVTGKDKVGGALKVGFGTAVAAGAVFGGIPLTVAAIGLLGAKMTHSIVKSRKAKKAAEQSAAAEQAPTQPQALPQAEASQAQAPQAKDANT